MGRFLRRVFMILVLLLIAFFVYRYINPEGASELVEKIKAIPDNIFGSDDESVNITGTTLLISGDVSVSVDSGDMVETGEGLLWLEELNQEIDEILGQEDVLTGEVLEDENLDFLYNTGNVSTGEVDDGFDDSTGVVQNNLELQDTVTTEVISGIDLEESTTPELTDSDYQQIEDVFGNLVE